MQEVFQRASALGEAIQRSDEYRAMRASEAAVMADPEAARAMGEFLERKSQVEAQLSAEQPDHAALAEHSQALQGLQDALGAMELVRQMSQARAAFTEMMRQVNQVLRFMVTGEMGEEAEGCGGNCGGCSGGCGDSTVQ